MLSGKETIVACSTPPGRGAISTIRLSGQKAFTIIKKITKKELNKKITILKFPLDNDLDEKCVLTIFKSPESYTGEDVVEISCHGSVYVQQKILKVFQDMGARLAEPGEFTLRAFLNKKMDLAQAEAVADLIHSDSEASHICQQFSGSTYLYHAEPTDKTRAGNEIEDVEENDVLVLQGGEKLKRRNFEQLYIQD